LLATADSYDEYKPYLEENYLKILHAEAKITRGLGDAEQWASQVSPEFYRELRDRVDIDFAPESALKFSPESPVALDLLVKNVPSLLVQVYEVNAGHHYRTKQTEIDTDLPLDGLVAGKTLKLEFADSPFKRTARRVELPELKGPGVWVVDLIGAGRSSRALIRKGRFDQLFWLDLPTPEERKEIFTVVIKKYNRDPKDFNLKALVNGSEGFTGAEIEEVFKDALYKSFDAGRDVSDGCLTEVLAEFIPFSISHEEDLKLMRKQAQGKLVMINNQGDPIVDVQKNMRKLSIAIGNE
jgi:hypothetical protein